MGIPLRVLMVEDSEDDALLLLEQLRDYPLEIQHRDGQVTSVLYNATVYRDEKGQVLGVFAAARDITERKQAEEQLQKKQIEQVILNLIQNGLEAMNANEDRPRRLYIETDLPEPNQVRDTGKGMTEETRPHIFDSFFTTKPEGLGMGLPICRSIIENPGHPTPGHG